MYAFTKIDIFQALKKIKASKIPNKLLFLRDSKHIFKLLLKILSLSVVLQVVTHIHDICQFLLEPFTFGGFT